MRDELIVKLNDMFFEHESRNTQVMRRLIEDRKLNDEMMRLHHSDVPGNTHGSRTSTMHGIGSKGGSNYNGNDNLRNE